MNITPMIMNIDGQNILYIWNVSLKSMGIIKNAPTAITIMPDVLLPEDPIVMTSPIATRSIGQLNMTLSMNPGKKPVFLSTRKSPAITSITPMIALLLLNMTMIMSLPAIFVP